jgi:hypothetical protein
MTMMIAGTVAAKGASMIASMDVASIRMTPIAPIVRGAATSAIRRKLTRQLTHRSAEINRINSLHANAFPI